MRPPFFDFCTTFPVPFLAWRCLDPGVVTGGIAPGWEGIGCVGVARASTSPFRSGLLRRGGGGEQAVDHPEMVMNIVLR